MRATVDKSLCMGCGVCPNVCPEVFEWMANKLLPRSIRSRLGRKTPAEMLRNSAPQRPSSLTRTKLADCREAKPRRKVDNMSVQIDGNTTVRELAGRYPQTRKVFEQYGIDYCCGGGRCLAEAAQDGQAALADLIRDIETALVATSPTTADAEKDWYAALSQRIDRSHSPGASCLHERGVAKAQGAAAEGVARPRGEHDGDMLRQVHDLYHALDTELSNHLRKEEEVLFPYIVAAEAHRQGGPRGTCGLFRISQQSHSPNGSRTRRRRRSTGADPECDGRLCPPR